MDWLAALIHPFLQWLWRTTLLASLVICLILVVQKSLGHKLGPRWSHALWLVLLIRMVVPWAPQSRISLLNLLPSSIRQAQLPPMSNLAEQGLDFHSAGVSEAVKATTEQQATSSQSARKVTSQRPQAPTNAQQSPGSAFLTRHWVLPMLWLAGAALVGAYLFAGHFALWRIVKRERPLVDQSTLELLEECKTRMGVQTLVAAVPSSQIGSPALFGFVRPRLLLPRQMLDTASRDEMRYVFLHELAHLKRHDIYLGWITSLLQVLHWFNPLVWFAFHRMRSDRELACDALVLARTGEQESQEYGRAIVALLQRLSRSRPLLAMAGILESKSQLKRRIAMIARFKNNSYRWSPLAVALTVILCCISLPDAKLGKAAQPSAAVKPTAASVSSEQPLVGSAGESSVFVDPNTGITFRRARTLSGPSDVIESTTYLRISPSGRFLVSGVKVVPLDGSQPFDLADTPNMGRSALSPDGKRVAFAAGALWVVPLDPETGHPTGPAEKLCEGDDFDGMSVAWSADSEKVTFFRRNKGGVWGVSVGDKSLAKVRDLPGEESQSPDGKHLAFRNPDGLWVKATEGEQAEKLCDEGRPILWSADSQWLLYSLAGIAPWGEAAVPQFFRLAGGRRVAPEVPGRGSLVGLSADHKKLFYYCPSYDWRNALEVIPVSGGPICELGRQMRNNIGAFLNQFWAPDSRSIVVEGQVKGKGNDRGLWALPLSGDAPIPLRMDISVPGTIGYHQFSPGLDYVLFPVTGDNDKTCDLWGVPVSWKQMCTTGPAVLIFRNWDFWPGPGLDMPATWSPDGKKIAATQWRKDEIWIASVEGGEPVLLTRSPGLRGLVVWSPDSSMIAFDTYLPDKGNVLHVVSASGREPKPVMEFTFSAGRVRVGERQGQVAWSPDGKALTIADGRMILSVPISGGQSQSLVNLDNVGMNSAFGLRWSSDGKILTFGKPSFGNPVLAYHSQDARVTEIADKVIYYFWSPDGKWISIAGFRAFKARAEGILWEMDVEEALAKLGK